MEFADVAKNYIELGLTGLSAIIIIWLFVLTFHRNNDKDDEREERANKKEDNMENRFDEMLELIKKQNEEYQKQQSEMINQIINGVTSHVPSAEDNSKLIKITEEVDSVLAEILKETGADRVNLVQYHNGGRGINKQAFLKMSITNEQVKFGVKTFMSDFKDQFRSVLAYFVKELNDNGECYISNVEDLKNIDNSMYDYMKEKGIESKFGIAIRNHEDTVIAFVSVEFINKELADINKIDRVLKDSRKVFETLLSL